MILNTPLRRALLLTLCLLGAACSEEPRSGVTRIEDVQDASGADASLADAPEGADASAEDVAAPEDAALPEDAAPPEDATLADVPAEDDASAEDDAGAGEDAASGDDAGLSCAAPLELCEASCVDLQADLEHCGRCGRRCEVGDRCEAGQCSSAILAYEDHSVSGERSCFLRASGQLECWGGTSEGELGVPRLTGSVPVPMPVKQPVRFTSFDVASRVTCAIGEDEQLYCWGYWPNLSIPGVREDQLEPLRVEYPGFGVRQVSVQNALACELLTDGSVRCRGLGKFGTATPARDEAALAALRDVVQVEVSDAAVAALRSNGEVLCWGDARFGRCGGGEDGVSTGTPTLIPGLPPIAQLAAGEAHFCALSRAGEVWCWGPRPSVPGDETGSSGALVQVQGLPEGIVEVSAASGRSCARSSAGEVWCWGYVRDSLIQRGPTLIETPVPPAHLWAGDTSSCVTDADGALFCWDRVLWRPFDNVDLDSNFLLEEARAATRPCDGARVSCEDTCVDPSTDPLHCGACGVRCDSGRCVDGACAAACEGEGCRGGEEAIQVSVGLLHACAAQEDGRVRCWGGTSPNDGLGTYRRQGDFQTVLAEIEGVRAISAGDYATCALVDVDPSDATPSQVWCWGGGSSTMIGLRPEGSQRRTPLPVAGTEGAVTIDVGARTSCAVMEDATARCWGEDLNPASSFSSAVPLEVEGLEGLAQLRAGDSSMLRCARQRDGVVLCWSPARLNLDGYQRFEALNAVDLDVGEGHACAVTASGGVWCWGMGAEGQLGDGSLMDRAAPVEVVGLPSPAVQVALGASHACALLESGAVWCWGAETTSLASGLLGDRGGRLSATPVQVRFLSDAVGLSASDHATCAVRAHGEVLCWGSSIWRQPMSAFELSIYPQPAPRPQDRVE